jgi:hypothetical protein
MITTGQDIGKLESQHAKAITATVPAGASTKGKDHNDKQQYCIN